MVKEITFEQKNPQMGQVKGILRIIGKDLFIKVNTYKYGKQLIDKFKTAGCKVEESKDWIKVDLFYTHKSIILAGTTLDSEEELPEELENKLYNFYMLQYAKAGMKVEGKSI